MDRTPLALDATYFRTALLLGLVRGDVVQRWAEDAMARSAEPAAALVEIVSTPAADLTALRHALFPLVIDPEPIEVLQALLGRLQSDLASGRRSVADTVTILRQMRSMLRLPREIYDEVNAALVASVGDSTAIAAWLSRYEGRLLRGVRE